MPDLLVDTTAQRMAARDLRAAAQVAREATSSGGRLRAFVPSVGTHKACASLGHFLGEWTYGMGLIAHQVETLASYLETAASAYESIELQLSQGAGGSGAGFSVPPASPLPEPPAKRPAASWMDASVFGLPVTMASATTWRQLMPGEPEDVRRLAAMLEDFELDTARAAAGLRRLSTSDWPGAAAQAFAGHLEEGPARLDTAARAFGGAGIALQRYAGELEAAQRGAEIAWRLWHDAAARAEGGADPAMAGAGSEDAQVRALGALRSAREDGEGAARMLAAALDEASSGAPNEPGLLARMTHAVVSFATGAGEGVAGMVEGAVALATLAVKLQPAYAITHPHDYLKTVDGLLTGVQFMATHPGATGKALVDWDTWMTDPARAAGRLVPDLLLAIATAGVGTAATRGVKAADELTDLAKVAAKAGDVAEDAGSLAAHEGDLPTGALDEFGDVGHLEDLPVPRPEPDPMPDLYEVTKGLEKGSPEWAQAVSDAYPVLTKDDVLAIHDYTTSSYRELNGYLRNPVGESPELRASLEARTAAIEHALANLTMRGP